MTNSLQALQASIRRTPGGQVSPPGATSRRRCFTGLVTFLVFGVVALAMAPVLAESEVALASNIDEPASTTHQWDLSRFRVATLFKTGMNHHGYEVTSVEFDFKTVGDAIPTVSIYEAGYANSGPRFRLAELSAPSTINVGKNTFTAPAGVVLSDLRDYFVVVEKASDAGVLSATPTLPRRPYSEVLDIQSKGFLLGRWLMYFDEERSRWRWDRPRNTTSRMRSKGKARDLTTF